MKKKDYQKPTMNVVHVQMQQMLCTSGKGYEVIGTGEDNLPPAAPSLDVLGDWDE